MSSLFADRLLRLGLLSRLAQQVVIVMMPPLALIFLVLGTIFVGIATPTEGGAMGATGALAMALAKQRLNWSLLRQAMNATAKLSSFVIFILIGSSVFTLVFRGVNGDLWVESLLTSLPGGQVGFLVVVNLMVFVLAFFLDYFELAFIVVPLLRPVAEKLGIDLVWFGVLLAINMQTSFLHPPFGFALFYFRSVAPMREYIDRITSRLTAPVTTAQIYWGSIPFVCIQLLMVADGHRLPVLRAGLARSGQEDRPEQDPDRGAAAKGQRDPDDRDQVERYGSAPDFAGGFDDEAQFCVLLLDRQRVAVDGRGKAALRAEAELVERDVFRGFVDPALQQVLAFELRSFACDEAEHHAFLTLRHKAQRLEPAGARVVVFEKEAVDREFAEQRLGDVVIAALGHPGGAEITATHMGADRHALPAGRRA